MSTLSSSPPVHVLGHYVLKELIGSGGAGEVYLATDTRLERDVAIKLLRPEKGALREHLRGEALVLSQLNHPSIAAVYDCDCDRDTWFLVSEYVPGKTLKELIEAGPVEESEILRMSIEIAEALSAAHKHNIVHRDLKPANVRLAADGRVKVLDFGLAFSRRWSPDKETTDEPVPSSSGGTLHYMSPEALRGEPVDLRSDIYSLGVLIYELATGRVPFDGSTAAALADAVLNSQALAPTHWRPQLSPKLEDVILRCLEKNPAHRYQTCLDLAADLRRVVDAGHTSEQSLVVLYFENMSGDQNAYFRDGITEDITTELARIRELRLFSRSAVLPYRDKPVTPSFVGQKLGAAYVLEGSIRRESGRLRVTANLVKTRTGVTVWAERYDREFRDIFAIQEDIARSIGAALKLVLTEKEVHAISTPATSDVRAYDFYLRGRHFFHQFRRRGYVLAREMFEKAIEVDPHYARAYAGIADCWSFEYMYWDSRPELLEQADATSRKALELDASQAEGHASRGVTASLCKRFDEAQSEFETAIRLNPKLFEAFYFFARLMYSRGNLEAACQLFEKASQVSEEYQALMLWASTLNGLGKQAEAASVYRRGVLAAEKHLEFHPEDVRALYFGANGLTQLGEKDRARRWVARALDLEGEEPLVVYNVACVYALLGDVEPAIDCLERSVTKGFGQKEWMKNDPDLECVRAHPRFKKLVGVTEENS